MRYDADRVRHNVARASTVDLLDRATVFRTGMEPESLDIIEAELRRRGLGPNEIEAHADSRQRVLFDGNGLPLQCLRCHRPAVWQGWKMHKLIGLLPVFPWRIALCDEHFNQG